eukprot:g6786.t1
MGRRWRRLSERFRQQLAAPHFQPASIERNQLMFREATEYCQQFKTLVRKLTRLLKNYSEWTSCAQKLLETRIPRLYSTEPDGTVSTEFPDNDELLAMGVKTDRLELSSQSMDKRMTEEVLNGFHNWFTVYETCRVAFHELMALKFELDSRQRTVISLDYRKHNVENKIEREEAEGVEQSTSRGTELKQTAAKLEHKEQKRSSCMKEFQQKEEELNQQLRVLLMEVSNLTELIGAAFKILTETPQEVCLAFRDKVSQGVPSFMSAVVATTEDKTKQSLTIEAASADTPNPFLTQN